MISLKEELFLVEIGDPSHFRNLTLFPLLRPKPPVDAPSYLLAEDAIARGLARVTELNGGGSVPELRFENLAAQPVLLLDGEELIGAKQNRVLNLTILAPSKQSIVIPVSCVEAGRWRMDTAAEFRPAPHVMYPAARAERMADVTESMRASGGRASNQSAVWSNIAAKAARMAAPSPTGAMSAVYEKHSNSVEEYLRALTWQERQAGVVFAIEGRPLGFDLFDHPETMRRLFSKIVRSYALDAVEAVHPKTEPASRASVCELLDRVSAAPLLVEAAVGLGKDVRLAGQSVSGGALWAEERYIHVCAFATNGNGAASEAPFQTRISRPMFRR